MELLLKKIGSSEEKGILDIDLKDAAYPSGLMDMVLCQDLVQIKMRGSIG